MKKLIAPILFVAVVWLSMDRMQAGAATVRLIDESSFRGDLISVDGPKLTFDRKAATQPTTRMSIDMADIAQVVFREPPAPKAPVQPIQPQGQDSQDTDDHGGVLNTLGSIFGGSSDSGGSAAPPAPGQPRTTPPPASRPAAGIRWLMKLKSGDVLHGHITQWADQKLTLKLDAPAGQALQIPGDQLVELWCGTDLSQRKAAAIKIDAGAEDVAFVEKDDSVIFVKGVALDITGDALRFKFGDEERKISLGRLVGVVFAAGNSVKKTESFHQAVRLDSGDVLTGIWTGADDKTVSVRSAWGATVKIPVGNIYTIDFLGGRQVYLSDLIPSKVEQTPFFGRVIPFRLDRSLEGGPLKMSDGTYAKGIAVHSRCVLQYDIQGGFDHFQAKLGFEDPSGKTGSVSARILGDDKVLYENTDARGDQKPVQINVDVTGVQTLTLEVDFGKGQDVAGRVVWANARLLRAKVSQ